MDDLLRSAFTNEGLRRMTRKAGVSSTREKDLVVNDVLRVVAEIILRNICDKLAILAEYHDRTTVSEAILREALRSLEVRMDSYAVPREQGFRSCESLRSVDSRKRSNRDANSPAAQARAQARATSFGARSARGSVARDEIKHEQANSFDCVYLEKLPFARLLRAVVQDGAHPVLKFQPRVVSWIQFVVESLLITILRHTGQLVREISKGHAKPGTKPKREAINARDLAAQVDILKESWPILRGRRREKAASAERGRGRGRGRESGRGTGRRSGEAARPSPKPKAKSKAKAEPTRRTTRNL